MGTAPRPRERYGAVVLGALVLVLCAVVAATSDGPSWVGAQREAQEQADEHDDGAGDTAENPSEEQQTGSQEEERERAFGFRPPLRTALLLLGCLGAAVVVLALAQLRLVRRRRRLSGEIKPRAGLSRLDAAEPEPEDPGIAAAVEDGTRLVEEGSPRNAIVEAWLRLEQGVESERFPHRPEETPTELVARVLAAYDLDRDAIDRLATRYREARFSTHPVTEAHRAEARECLEVVLAALRGQRARDGARR